MLTQHFLFAFLPFSLLAAAIPLKAPELTPAVHTEVALEISPGDLDHEFATLETSALIERRGDNRYDRNPFLPNPRYPAPPEYPNPFLPNRRYPAPQEYSVPVHQGRRSSVRQDRRNSVHQESQRPPTPTRPDDRLYLWLYYVDYKRSNPVAVWEMTTFKRGMYAENIKVHQLREMYKEKFAEYFYNPEIAINDILLSWCYNQLSVPEPMELRRPPSGELLALSSWQYLSEVGMQNDNVIYWDPRAPTQRPAPQQSTDYDPSRSRPGRGSNMGDRPSSSRRVTSENRRAGSKAPRRASADHDWVYVSIGNPETEQPQDLFKLVLLQGFHEATGLTIVQEAQDHLRSKGSPRRVKTVKYKSHISYRKISASETLEDYTTWKGDTLYVY